MEHPGQRQHQCQPGLGWRLGLALRLALALGLALQHTQQPYK